MTRPLLLRITDCYDDNFRLIIPETSWALWLRRESLLNSFICFVSDEYDLSDLKFHQRKLVDEEIIIFPEKMIKAGLYYDLNFRNHLEGDQYASISIAYLGRASQIPEGLLVE